MKTKNPAILRLRKRLRKLAAKDYPVTPKGLPFLGTRTVVDTVVRITSPCDEGSVFWAIRMAVENPGARFAWRDDPRGSEVLSCPDQESGLEDDYHDPYEFLASDIHATSWHQIT